VKHERCLTDVWEIGRSKADKIGDRDLYQSREVLQSHAAVLWNGLA